MNEDKYLAHINTSIDSLNILLNTPSHQISEFPGVKAPDGLCRISLISDGRWENATITFFTFDYLFCLGISPCLKFYNVGRSRYIYIYQNVTKVDIPSEILQGGIH